MKFRSVVALLAAFALALAVVVPSAEALPCHPGPTHGRSSELRPPYSHYDHLMTAIAAVDDTGTVIRTSEHWAYGVPKTGPGLSDPGVIGFAGARRDPRTGLLFLRNRVYSPELMRFLSRDPIGFEGGTWNLYSYANDAPVGYRDPLGLKLRYAPGLPVPERVIQLVRKVKRNRALLRRIERSSYDVVVYFDPGVGYSNTQYAPGHEESDLISELGKSAFHLPLPDVQGRLVKGDDKCRGVLFGRARFPGNKARRGGKGTIPVFVFRGSSGAWKKDPNYPQLDPSILRLPHLSATSTG